MQVSCETSESLRVISKSGRNAASGFIGNSEPFQKICASVRNVAAYDSPVVIVGETGTGKEMVARQIHLSSGRRDGRFFPVNCSAISGSLFESQFFGHVKGAFTGAEANVLGYFRAADGGTLFLDEIAEMDLSQQAKLLRVLQEGCVRPVGSTELYPVDVRVICATNRDLKVLVREGKFRADVYFRLNVVTLSLPPLRDRKKDILLLAEHFLRRQAELYGEPGKSLSRHTRRLLVSYRWPGNVRELANVMEHAYVTTLGAIIDLDSLPPGVFTGEDIDGSGEEQSLEEITRKAVIKALDHNKGRKTLAARELQISYRKLAHLVDKYALQAKHSS